VNNIAATNRREDATWKVATWPQSDDKDQWQGLVHMEINFGFHKMCRICLAKTLVASK